MTAIFATTDAKTGLPRATRGDYVAAIRAVSGRPGFFVMVCYHKDDSLFARWVTDPEDRQPTEAELVKFLCNCAE